jgi:hypothetical protein
MPGPLECWVCGRTAEEISAVFHIESTEDAELAKQASQIDWFKSKFMDSAVAWRKAIPKDFKDMDFLFVISNPDQFKAIKMIAEVDDSRKLMMDWLVKASYALRKGEEGPLQIMKMSWLSKEERVSIVGSLEQFESRWHRRLARDEGEAGGPNELAGFQGLSLTDGLEFLIAGGLLYYDIQVMLIQYARRAAASRLPQWRVEVKAVGGYAPVAVCDICAGLITGLRGTRPEIVTEVEAHVEQRVVPSQPKPSSPPEAPVPEVVPTAPKKTRAQEAADEIPAGASPEFVELIKKIGPSAEETAPKTHNLHEHRLKEDWDEMVEGKAKQA